MTLLRWVPTPDGAHRSPEQLGYEYRIADPARWKAWLAKVAGTTDSEVEVVQHQLRVVERHPALVPAVPPDGGDDRAATEESAATTGRATVTVAITSSASVATPSTAATDSPMPAAIPETAVTESPAPAVTPEVEPVPAGTARFEDEVRQRVVAMVADKTGYPPDMLDLELDLEADLGVDTVKQAELFATVREAYAIPRDDQLKLRDFPTLDHVIRFVLERAHHGAAGPAPAASPETAATDSPAAAGTPVGTGLLRPAASRTRCVSGWWRWWRQDRLPPRHAGPGAGSRSRSGCRYGQQAELLATVREAYAIARDDRLELRDFPTLDHVIRFAAGAGPS